MADEKRIAFASCMSAVERPQQPVWAEVLAKEPHALMLLGDLIYMDWGLETKVEPSKWKKRLTENLNKWLPQFESEMHGRYARQWRQREFQALIRYVVGSGGALFVTRDDHDFAWNNCTAAGIASRPAFVPARVKEVSDRLFRQFVRQLLTPQASHSDDYPLPGAADPPLAAPPRSVFGVRTIVLDQRSFRMPIDEPAATLLGVSQAQALWAAVREGSGLMIVGGSTPMRYRRDGGWITKTMFGNPKHEYVEYRRFVQEAADTGRPILYLGGDVHENHYEGPVEEGSTIVQVLSSGAAQPPVFSKDIPWLPDPKIWKNRPGNFGLLTLADLDEHARNGAVQIQLFRQAKVTHAANLSLRDGQWSEAMPSGSGVAAEQPV